MRIDPRRALVAWVALVVAAAAVVARYDPVLAVRGAFLVVPAGFLAALLATAVRSFLGPPASTDP